MATLALNSSVLLALIVSLCKAQLLVFMKNGQQTQSDSLPVTVAADATVRDLASELLKYPAEITGLPRGFLSANSIIVTHHGQELNPNDELADVGVCAEALLSYDVKEIGLSLASVCKQGSNWCRSSFGWSYRIPVGHHDILNLMVQQTHNNLLDIDIGNETIIHFTFVFVNTTQRFSAQMPAFIDSFRAFLTNEFDFDVNGRVRLVERCSLHKERKFDFASYRCVDDIVNQQVARCSLRGHYLRYTRLKFEIDVSVIAGEPQKMVSSLTPDMSVRVNVPSDITLLLHDVTTRIY